MLTKIIDIITWKTCGDNNMTGTDKAGSQQWTAVLSFLGLIATYQRRYVAAAQEPKHLNSRMTHSLYQVLYFELTCVLKQV